MKFKERNLENPAEEQQNKESNNSSFYDDIVNLLCLNCEFNYAIRSLYPNIDRDTNFNLCKYLGQLERNYDLLIKLSVSLNSKHTLPILTITKKPAKDNIELLKFEEKYYNMLKEIGKNAIEENEFEVLAYLSEIARTFNHYFCTIVHENNDSRETSS